MRPRPARPSPRAPHSPGARARVRPLGPPTYRAQANPKGLWAAAGPSQPAARRARASGGPSIQEHFFGRHDTRLLPPDSSPDRPGLALARSPSQLAAAVRGWPSLAPTRSWRGRGALQPPVPGGRGEAGRAERRPRPVSTSPDPPTACRGGLRAVQKYGDLLTAAP